LKEYTFGIFDIHRASLKLLRTVDLNRRKIRLIGISVSKLNKTFGFADLMEDSRSRDESLTEAIDIISRRFGEDKLTLARIIKRDDIMD
jgi:hypothetical protein